MFTTWLAPFNKPNSSWRVKDPLGGASNLEMKDAFLLFHVSFLLMQTRLTHLKDKWFGPSYKLQRHILPVQCYCVVTVVTKVNFSKKVLSVLRSQQHRWHIGFFRDLCQHFHLARHQTCCKTLLSELGLSSVSQNGSAGPFFFFFFHHSVDTRLVSCTAVKCSAPSTTWPYADETAFSGEKVRCYSF